MRYAIVVLYLAGLHHGIKDDSAAMGQLPVSDMVAARDIVYAGYGDSSMTHTMDMSHDLMLNAMRSHLLMPVTSDEQIMIGQLSRIRHHLPDSVQYGNLAPAVVGCALVVAHLVGYLRLTSDIGYYLTHPVMAGRIYMVGRSASMLAVFGTAVLL